MIARLENRQLSVRLIKTTNYLHGEKYWETVLNPNCRRSDRSYRV